MPGTLRFRPRLVQGAITPVLIILPLFTVSFFLSFYNQFFRIDTLGNVKAFGHAPVPEERDEAVFQMFRLENNLFAVGSRTLFISRDEGENWSVYAGASGARATWLSYFNVGNEVYAAINSQIWRVILSGNNFFFKELDNDGLETNHITSVNKAGKYAFVTTLSGLYYRDTASFNTPKK